MRNFKEDYDNRKISFVIPNIEEYINGVFIQNDKLREVIPMYFYDINTQNGARYFGKDRIGCLFINYETLDKLDSDFLAAESNFTYIYIEENFNKISWIR